MASVVELALEERRVRRVADGDEDAVHGEVLHARPSCCCAITIDGDFALAGVLDLLDLGVPLERDLRVGEGLVLHDLRRAQRLAPVDHGDVRREPREEDRLFHRRVAAADDGDGLAAEEIAVAGGAGRHAVADQRALRGQAEQPGRRAGRDDQRARLVFGVGGLDRERMRQQIDRRDVAADDLGAEALAPARA